jgi:two-component system nitrate/nitrite response regulator NarL
MPPSTTNVVRVMLIDDHAVVRAGLRMLIESQPELAVVAEAKNRDEALVLAAQEQPNIILLDLDLGGENSLDFLPDLCSATNGAQVILLTGARDPELHRRAVRLGVRGLVLKEQASEVLIKAIEKVHNGEIWLDRSLMANVLAEMSRETTTKQADPEAAKIASLTVREREVIALIGEGLKNKQIAERLFISETTVRHHLTSIFNKLDVSDRLELVIYAYRHGLAKPPK